MSFQDDYRRECIVIDFDGTLMPDEGMPWPYDPSKLDADLITECQAAGYAVAISTCATADQVAVVLRANGFAVTVDHEMTHYSWHHGSTVLVTNRKVHGAIFLDDRAENWHYGDDHARLWRELDRRQGYHSCVNDGDNHWGPHAAAWLLAVD